MIEHTQLIPAMFPEAVQTFFGSISHLAYPIQGWTSDVVIVECRRGKYVVKRSCGEKYNSWMTQEYKNLQALITTPLPIPRPYLFIQQPVHSAIETWLVMDYLPGESLKTILRQALPAAARYELLRAFGEILARLHAQPVPPALLAGTQQAWLERMLVQARFHLLNYETDGSHELLEQLESYRPSVVKPVLIHGDFTIDNVLIDNNKVSGIIDWANGGFGDPRYDLALAMRTKDDIFDSPLDNQAFVAGYGSDCLSLTDYRYFNALYEFF